MKYEHKIIDQEKKIARVPIADERWYMKEGITPVPSVTWIASYYYTSPYLIKWIAEKGMSESERIRDAAGFKGSRVHKAVDLWLNGIEIRIDTKIEHEGESQELTAEENECFKSFIDFYKEVKPEILLSDYIVWGDGYAGTVDLKCKINGEIGILDFKSSQQIYKEHELQVSAYKHADEDKEKIRSEERRVGKECRSRWS